MTALLRSAQPACYLMDMPNNTTAPAGFLAILLSGVGVAPTDADRAGDALDRAVARAAHLRAARARIAGTYGYGRRSDAATLDVIDADRAVAAFRGARA